MMNVYSYNHQLQLPYRNSKTNITRARIVLVLPVGWFCLFIFFLDVLLMMHPGNLFLG